MRTSLVGRCTAAPIPGPYVFSTQHENTIKNMSSQNCEKDYADFTIPQLKAELRKRGGRLSGKKHQLIERYV
jgi:hypothetical protein